MAKEITIPRLGWSMDEGSFAGWIKNDGDSVAVGDALFTLEGEKSLQEMESLDSGTLRIFPGGGPKIGETVKVGQLIGYLTADGEPMPSSAASSTPAPSPVPVTPAGTTSSLPEETQRPSFSQVSTPRARKAAMKLGVDIESLKGTGREGRVRERDVKAAVPKTPGPDPVATPLSLAPKVEAPTESDIPVTSLRRIIAERMLVSLANTAPVTLTTRANATHLIDLRSTLKAYSEGSSVPSYTEIIAKLTANVIATFPIIAGRWEGDRISLPRTINIGVAVDTAAGLVVPVIRDVARISLPELVVQSRRLIDAARNRSLKAEEMQGGVFSITSLGSLGIDSFTPIINYPEVAILGLGAIRRIPGVLADGTIAPVSFITLSMTFDHRVLDGAPAARFLQSLVDAIENPTAGLLGFAPSRPKTSE